MRITRDALLKLAKDTVEKRFAHDPKVTAVFLIGSFRPEQAQATIESAADVDLLVLHNGELPQEREIVKLSDDYHLDIAYEPVSLYSQPRELRGDGWKGWTMWDPRLLHQRGRFFEYTQSVVRAQFDEPFNIIKRSRYFTNLAREAWLEIKNNPESASPFRLLETCFDSANALVSLNGTPLTERRMLADFPVRAKALGQDELIHTMFTSVSKNVSAETIQKWLVDWEKAFRAISLSPSDLRLHPARLAYYKTAIVSQLGSDMPRAALWPLLFTWALAAENGSFTDEQASSWAAVCTETGLDNSSMPERLTALDEFLDRMEEILEELMVDNGL